MKSTLASSEGSEKNISLLKPNSLCGADSQADLLGNPPHTQEAAHLLQAI
jgi:hypothetical protein